MRWLKIKKAGGRNLLTNWLPPMKSSMEMMFRTAVEMEKQKKKMGSNFNLLENILDKNLYNFNGGAE